MQCDTSTIKGWERANLVRNAMKKTFQSKRYKKMTRQANNQTPTPSPAQDFKHIQNESKVISKMIIVKEWLCNLFKMFS